ncbi:MAG: hypothetical protein R2748_28640 [Bryobacterales bacterium]
MSEFVGDIIINMSGGQPTPAGQPAPTYDFRIFTSPSTNITSRILGGNEWSEAFLFIDDPTPANQAPLVIPPGGAFPTLTGVGGSGINYANPSAQVNGGQPVPNVYQGRQGGPAAILWHGIPIDPPQTGGTRRIRITNVRLNAHQLGVSAPPGPVTVQWNVSIEPTAPGSSAVQLTGPAIPLVRDPVDFSIVRGASEAPSFLQCQDKTIGAPDFFLRFRENFPSMFKPRNAGTTAQNPGSTAPHNQLGINFSDQYQSGFFNPSFPSTNGLDQAGLADHGTRLMARFDNMPAGVQVYVAESLQNGALQARMTANPEGPFTLPPADGLPGLQEVLLQDGSGQAVWEIVKSDPAVIEDLPIPVFFAWVARPSDNLPALGTATVNGRLAPLSTGASSSAAAPIPRFADAGVQRSLLTINTCSTNLLYPFVTSQAGFETGIAVSNTSRDPFGSYPRGDLVIAGEGSLTGLTLDVNATKSPRLGVQATSNWLTVELDYTSTPATASYSVNPTGLTAGTYGATIRVASPNATQPLEIPFELHVASENDPAFHAYGVVNAAGYQPAAVSPGEGIVIFGKRFGPATIQTLEFDQNGRATTSLGGVQVFFDDVAAPLIYAVNGQISVFVPFSVAGKKTTNVRVEQNGRTSLDVSLPVVDAAPGVFTLDQSGAGQGAILNQDNSLNGANNPAAIGDIVALFGTGGGQTEPAGVDGRPAGAPLPALLLPTKAFVDGIEAEVLYAGPAPTLVEGVLQVNLRIPSGVVPRDDVPVWIMQGKEVSQAGVTVAVR